MSRRVLTPAAAMQIKAMYEELDERGRKRYSQMQIAKILMVSETTVFRAIQGGGAYASLPEVPDAAAAEASLERLNRLLAEQRAVKERGEQAVEELMHDPLDGRDVSGLSDDAKDRLKGYL